MKTATELTTD